MKKKFKVFIVAIFTLLVICNVNIFAATVNISANTSVEVGNNVTINISVPGVTGKCTVTSSNPSVISVSTGSVWVEKGATSPIVGYTKGAGSATITVTPTTMADDNTGDDVVVAAKSITVNVKEKYVPPTTNQNTNNNTTNNNNNSNNNTTTKPNTNVSQNTNTNTNTSTTKSSNAFLSKLQVNVEGLSPNFNKNKFSYTLALGEKVDSVNVTAIAEHSKAKVAISGNTNLKEGDNTISIVVTAENGSKKTYTIIATKSADKMKSDSYLANLIIEGCELSPTFSSEVFEYDLGTVTLDKLNVFAYPKNESAKVEVTGNESLAIGENVIKIKVISVDKTTTKEYMLKVKKEVKTLDEVIETNALADENIVNMPSKGREIKTLLKQNWIVIILFILVIIEFIEIIYLYFKCRKLNGIHENNDKKENDIKIEENKIENDMEIVESTEKQDVVEEISEENLNEETDNSNISNNEIIEKINDEVQYEEKNQIDDDISYETILSQINELGNKIDNEINDNLDSDANNGEENENKEKRTRNGRI